MFKALLSAILLITVTSTGAQAQMVLSDGFPLPVACTEPGVEIDTPDCSLEDVMTALDVLSPGYGRQYHDAGLESFAIMTTLWEFDKTFKALIGVDDCMGVTESLYYLSESVSFYMPDVDNLPDSVAVDYRKLDGFLNKAFQYLETGRCGQ